MASKKKKTKKRRIKISIYYYILFFLILFLISALFTFKVFSIEDFNDKEGLHSTKNIKDKKDLQDNENPQHEEDLQIKEISQNTEAFKPEFLSEDKSVENDGILPEVAIVIDDLGISKRAAIKVLNLNASLTLSILPFETYSAWIAEEGHRQGYDIIGHIPMEARSGNRLGKGGIYIWMTHDEIRERLLEDLNSIPHIKGISNHMGSAFTENESNMDILMSVLKEQELFFLDSLTTSKSVSVQAASKNGVRFLKRDIFLDNRNKPEFIEKQWKKLVMTAQKNGYAIAIAHPRINTIEILEKNLPKNEVKVVPLSKLIANKL